MLSKPSSVHPKHLFCSHLSRHSDDDEDDSSLIYVKQTDPDEECQVIMDEEDSLLNSPEQKLVNKMRML